MRVYFLVKCVRLLFVNRSMLPNVIRSLLRRFYLLRTVDVKAYIVAAKYHSIYVNDLFVWKFFKTNVVIYSNGLNRRLKCLPM